MNNKILVINNDSEIDSIINSTISSINGHNFLIEIKKNIKSALSELLKSNFDLIIINHNIKKIDAIDAAKKIFTLLKKNDAFPPIIIMADINEDYDTLNAAFDMGIVDFIQKPVSISEFKIRVTRIIELTKKIESYKQSLIISGSLIDNLERHLLDIEKLKKQLEKENKRLFNILSTSQDEYAAYLHDLKAPFSALLGNCQLLLNDYLGELTIDQKNSISTIERSGQRLLALVDDYLDTSRIEAGKMQLSINKVDVPFLLELSLRDIITAIKDKGLTIETICNPDINIVEVDIDKIIRVIQNLLTNALKNTNTGGKIILKAENLDEFNVKISVIDDGCGISKSKQKAIFEKFNQGGKKIEGSGLGLTICKYIIENLHQGKISVESEENKGSSFYFILPVSYQIKEAEPIE